MAVLFVFWMFSDDSNSHVHVLLQTCDLKSRVNKVKMSALFFQIISDTILFILNQI